MPRKAFVFLSLGFSFLQTVLATSRTDPPSGALVVRAGTTNQQEYQSVSSALAALPNDSSSRSIFIYPGTYNEQVYITRPGPLEVRIQMNTVIDSDCETRKIYGYTMDTTTYNFNTVTIQAGCSAKKAGSDDASGTLRIHKDNFAMYNVDVKNTFGPGSQAIAISQYGSKVGLYACGFYGYQDTLYANKGAQVYLNGYIEVLFHMAS